MPDESQIREFCKLQLANWKGDPELAGAQIILLKDTESMESELRQVGELPELSLDDIRHAVLKAAETEETGWESGTGGVGYPLRFKGHFLGVCLLYPSGDLKPLSLWENAVQSFVDKVGPIAADLDEPPSLGTLAGQIPEEFSGTQGDSKPHWESSKTRVHVPPQEQLSEHMLLDLNPLF